MVSTSPTASNLTLSVDGLSCQRGDRLVFEEVSFTITGGEVVALLGPNGVGKTTLLRVIAGLLRPSSGQVVLDGAASDDQPHHAQVHFVGPQNSLKSAMTVEENLLFWQRYLGDGTEDRARIGLAMTTLELDNLADIPVGFLSTGQRRRAGLARLLAVARPVWLLDEPTLGLDVTSQEILGGMISDHAASDGLCLVATHADLGLGKVRELRLGLEAAV